MKEITLSQLEQILNNRAIKASKKERDDYKVLIVLDHVREDGKLECHTFNNGTSEEISAILAMRMFDSKAFCNMMYRAVICFEKVMKTKVENSLENVEDALDQLIDNLQKIVGEDKPNNNRKPRRNGKQHKS